MAMLVEQDGRVWQGDDCENMAAIHEGHVQTHGCWLLLPETKIIPEFDTFWLPSMLDFVHLLISLGAGLFWDFLCE